MIGERRLIQKLIYVLDELILELEFITFLDNNK